jgi:hypothetical protein
MLDGVEFGNEVVALVRGYVEREVAPLKAENEGLKARLKALEDRPAPEVLKGDPGESVDPVVINEMIVAEVAKAAAAIRVPQDGKSAAGIVEALKDSGELVLTLEDGRLIRTGIRDGEKGKDGFGFDDMDVAVLDDDRTIELSFRRGDEEKAFTLKWPTVIYRGVWKEREFAAGDSVTWGGSLWIAEKDTAAKPDTPDSGWKLAVKKGRDAKNG